jgi:hypothetical protein
MLQRTPPSTTVIIKKRNLVKEIVAKPGGLEPKKIILKEK